MYNMVYYFFALEICILYCAYLYIKKNQNKWHKDKENIHKLENHVRVLSEWVIAKQEGKSVYDILRNYNVRTVAIYGMAQLGELLIFELSGGDIEILYGIDRNPLDVFDFPIYAPDDDLPPVDMVIVTPFTYYEEIQRSLCYKLNCKFMPINDLIEEM